MSAPSTSRSSSSSEDDIVSAQPPDDNRNAVVNLTRPCALCHRTTHDPLQFGPLKKLRSVLVHYFCLLSSTAMSRRSRRENTVRFLLFDDIMQVLEETRQDHCFYCHLPNATVYCAEDGCERKVHFPCSLERGDGFRFYYPMVMYCAEHDIVAHTNVDRLQELLREQESVPCIICQEAVEQEGNKFVIATCCGSCVMHRTCAKRHTLMCGRDARCPNCTHNEEFVLSMRVNGVYVPTHRTDWQYEVEMMGSVEDVVNIPRCEADRCKCPHGIGRYHDARQGFCRLVRCRSCGGNYSHLKCRGTGGRTYECKTCRPVERRFREDTIGSQSPRRANLDPIRDALPPFNEGYDLRSRRVPRH